MPAIDVQDMLNYLTSNPNGTAPGVTARVDFSDRALARPRLRPGARLQRARRPASTAPTRSAPWCATTARVGTHEVDVTLNVPAKSRPPARYVYDSATAGATTTTTATLGLRGAAARLSARPPCPASSTIADSESLPDLVNDVERLAANDYARRHPSTPTSPTRTRVPVGPDGAPANVDDRRPGHHRRRHALVRRRATSTSTRTDYGLRPQSRSSPRGHYVRLVRLPRRPKTRTARPSRSTRAPAPSRSPPCRYASTPAAWASSASGSRPDKSTTTFRAVWGRLREVHRRPPRCKVRVLPDK